MSKTVNFENGTSREMSVHYTVARIDKEKDVAVDLITTLENYHDHKFLEKYRVEILNDYTIYNTALASITDNEWFYSYMRNTYNAF